MDYDPVTDIHRVALNAEISAFNEGIKQNNELLQRLRDSRLAVEQEVMAVIDTMGVSFDQKKESIEVLRNWRKTIVNEATYATNAINALLKNVSDNRIKQLRELVELIERLNKIDPGMIVGRLFTDTKN